MGNWYVDNVPKSGTENMEKYEFAFSLYSTFYMAWKYSRHFFFLHIMLSVNTHKILNPS